MEIEEMSPFKPHPPPGARVRVSGISDEPGLEGTGVVVAGALEPGCVRVRMDNEAVFKYLTPGVELGLVVGRPTIEVPTRCIEVVSVANPGSWEKIEDVKARFDEMARPCVPAFAHATERATCFDFESGSNVVLDDLNFGASSSSISVHTGDGVRAKVTERDGRIIFEAHLDERDQEQDSVKAQDECASDDDEELRREADAQHDAWVELMSSQDRALICRLQREVDRLRASIAAHREAIYRSRTIEMVPGSNQFKANARRVADDMLWSAANENR